MKTVSYVVYLYYLIVQVDTDRKDRKTDEVHEYKTKRDFVSVVI